MTGEERRKGNGCLYALLGLGFLMVIAALALAAMPELPSIDLDSPPPAPPEPYAQPQPAPMQPVTEPREPEPPPEPEPEPPTAPLFWFASFFDGEAEVQCLLRVDVTPALRRPVPRRAKLECTDGTRIEASVFSASLAGVSTPMGTRYRVVIPRLIVPEMSGDVSLQVNSGEHTIQVAGIERFGEPIFLEELSVPSSVSSLGIEEAAVQRPLVRLAVPTASAAEIPASITAAQLAGAEPAGDGPVCELYGGPTVDSGYNCRVTLRCAGELVYGAGTTGYNDCELSGGAISGASDTGPTSENSDPTFSLDVEAARLTVSDDVPTDWWARFSLVPDPRCEAREARYEGWIAGADSAAQPTPITLDPFDEEPSLTRDGQRAPLRGVVVSCEQRRVAFTTADGQTGRGWVSFGARSIAGTIGERAFWAFAR